MPVRYCIAQQYGLGVLVLSSSVTGHELIQAGSTMLNDSGWQPGYNDLWDGRLVKELSLDPDHVQEMMKLAQDFQKRLGVGKSVMVVSRDLDYAIASYLSRAIRLPTRQLRVFRSMTEAREWLDIRHTTS